MTRASRSRFLKNSKISLKILPERILLAQVTNCALSENDTKGGNPVWIKSIVIKEGLFFRKNTQQLEKKKANFNWENQYCQDIRFVETHILQFLTDRI